uniref:Uncharacterized protein n=1 Tax=Mesocestoides corti TaxID=53468 RepID=A0A5K3FWD4_MESCO
MNVMAKNTLKRPNSKLNRSVSSGARYRAGRKPEHVNRMNIAFAVHEECCLCQATQSI